MPRMTGSGESYWMSRRRLRYFRVVHRWVNAVGPGRLLLDVGGANTPVVTWSQFEQRIAVEPSSPYSGEDVSAHKQDWMTFVMTGHATVATCLEGLEHLSDERVAPFARKLLAHTEWAIMSVPCLWLKGLRKHHLQDPVSPRKLIGWCGRKPVRSRIAQDGRLKRLVALSKGRAHRSAEAQPLRAQGQQLSIGSPSCM